MVAGVSEAQRALACGLIRDHRSCMAAVSFMERRRAYDPSPKGIRRQPL